MKSELINIEKLTDNKYLNLYKSTFLMENGKYRDYFFASRRSFHNLGSKNSKYVDAVKVLPYFKKDGQIFVVLNYEFRSPISNYTYDLCAGLVEHQDDLESDVKREVKEELGAEVKNIKLVLNAGHTTAGLTDETLSCFFAEIELTGAQNLEEDEDISLKIITINDIPEFCKNNVVGAIGSLMLQLFYYQNLHGINY